MATTIQTLTGIGAVPAAAPARVSAGDDAGLVLRAQRGDQMAFREIVERYQNRVMSVIYRVLRDHDEAEDVAQEVFAGAFFSIRAFKCQTTLGAWLYRIAVNESFEYLRKKRVRPLVYESSLSADAVLLMHGANVSEPEFDTALAKREFVLSLLERISPGDRSMLLLKEVEGHSLDEIAAITGLNAATIKVRLFRARRKLAAAARHEKGSYKS